MRLRCSFHQPVAPNRKQPRRCAKSPSCDFPHFFILSLNFAFSFLIKEMSLVHLFSSSSWFTTAGRKTISGKTKVFNKLQGCQWFLLPPSISEKRVFLMECYCCSVASPSLGVNGMAGERRGRSVSCS